MRLLIEVLFQPGDCVVHRPVTALFPQATETCQHAIADDLLFFLHLFDFPVLFGLMLGQSLCRPMADPVK